MPLFKPSWRSATRRRRAANACPSSSGLCVSEGGIINTLTQATPWPVKCFYPPLPGSLRFLVLFFKKEPLAHSNWLPGARKSRLPLVALFRRADLADFSLGLIRGGVPGAIMRAVKAAFPNAGFHKRLMQLAGD